jgi:hypothetical protein
MTRVLLPVLLLAHAVSACGGGDEVPGRTGEAAGIGATVGGALEVRLTSDGIVPDTLRMAVGDTVRLVVLNETDGPLEFLIGRDPTASAFETPFFAGVQMLAMEGSILAAETPTGSGRPARPGGEMRHGQAYFYLRPGEKGSATFVAPPDHVGVWRMACFLEDHAREGFRGVVLMEAAPAR